MRQLHLHVISQDFDSQHLKNKKHWNSFNTLFFRDSVDVMQEIDVHGNANVEHDEKILSIELRCHRCKSAHPNISRLKSHIGSCRAPFPATLLENNRLVSKASWRYVPKKLVLYFTLSCFFFWKPYWALRMFLLGWVQVAKSDLLFLVFTKPKPVLHERT